MKENKLFSEEILRSLLQIALIILFYWFVRDTILFENIKNIVVSKITDTYLQEKLGDSLLIIVTLLTYFIAENIMRIFSRPIYITVKMDDFLSGDPYTKIVHFEGEKREKSNAVKIILNVIRKNTFWNALALLIIRTKNVQLLIEIGQENAILYCQPEIIGDQIEITETGFKMSIKDLINDNLENNVPAVTECEFLVEENSDIDAIGNCELSIKPKILIQGKPINIFYKLFFRFEINLPDGYYPIKYIR
jgi:hypothetical protein